MVDSNTFYTEEWIPVEYFSHWSEDINKDLKLAGLGIKKLYSRDDLKKFNTWCYKHQTPGARVDIRSMAINIFIYSLPTINDADKITSNYKPRHKGSKKNGDDFNDQE